MSTEISQKLAQEMANLVQMMSKPNPGPLSQYHLGRLNEHYQLAASIAARLPKPIDPDLIEARRLRKKWMEMEDEPEATYAILRGIKRGRELASEKPNG